MTVQDYGEQLKFHLALRDDLTKLSTTVDKLRSLKKQLLARNELLKEVAKAKGLIDDGTKLIAKLDILEGKLHNPKAEVTYDILAQKGGAKLYSQIGALYDFLGQGDGPIGQGMKEVYAEHRKELDRLQIEWRQIAAEDVVVLNRLALSLDVPTVYVPPEK